MTEAIAVIIAIIVIAICLAIVATYIWSIIE